MVGKGNGKAAPPPDELRCSRSDGRQWRCTRLATEGMKLCEIHQLQLKHRQCKRKVPDSLKLERTKTRSKFNNQAHKVVKKSSNKAAVALDEALKRVKAKRGDLKLDLLRVFLKSRVEKKKKKKEKELGLENGKEEVKELPNGTNLDNVVGDLDVKVAPIVGIVKKKRTCLKGHFKAINHKVSRPEFYREKRKVDKTQQLQYLIYTLLPVLAQINLEHSTEVAFEVKKTGKSNSDIVVQKAETSHENVNCCKCNISIADYHRSCSSCSYNLCLSCCKEFRPEDLFSDDEQKLKMNLKRPRRTSILSRKASRRWVEHDKSILCPCSDGFLELRSIYPIKWTKDIEVGAVEMLCDFNFSKTPDNSFCSLCKRVDSGDNFLFSPTLHELYEENLDHFQEHWRRGHPVIVRNVLRSATNLIWDPVVMFCAYLDKSCTSRIKGTNCLDWCEVEFNDKETFMGSLEGHTYANMRRKTVKFNAWLSSRLYQEYLPSHYAETLQALPVQEYMNPTPGLLNLAAKLPGETLKPELGPSIYISYGGPEELVQAESLIKLCYESCDVVNILAYATDDPISDEQLARIKSLMNKKSSKSLNQKEKTSMHSEDTGESGVHNVNKDEQISTVKDNNSSSYDSEYESDSSSDASILCSGSNEESEDMEDILIFQEDVESSSSAKPVAGARWDIFRRQDVPKLLEYLKKHSNELISGYCHPKHVVDDPILDRTFFLDAFHTFRLKKEYDVQPWSFDQHAGEAVIIPAGCPYQIKKLKSSVSIVLDFISPESANKCISLNDEIRLLPLHHKAKDKMFEVRKMALHGIDSAINELRDSMHSKPSVSQLN